MKTKWFQRAYKRNWMRLKRARTHNYKRVGNYDRAVKLAKDVNQEFVEDQSEVILPVVFGRCRWCDSAVRLTELACVICKRPLELRKQQTYREIIIDNALRTGKRVEKELMKAEIAQRRTFPGQQSNKELQQKLSAWLKKRSRSN